MRLFNISRNIFVFITLALIISCSESSDKEEIFASNHLIHISNEQFKAEQMKLGNAVMHSFTQVFKTNGIVTASPQAKAFVYSYVPGIIKTISVNLDSHVKKGQELCTIESKEFIDIQQQYLESLAKFKATESDYKRVKSLYNDKISSKKTFIAIESEYKVLIAKIKALKAQLKILNVNIKNLEKGNLETYLQVVSPIEGYITMQNCNLGQFADSQKLLMKVIDNRDLQLYFFVYQETVSKLKAGQLLNIYSSDDPENIYLGKIISIGKSLDAETKRINCIAELEDSDSQVFIPGMYFQVEVNTNSFITNAIPSEAIFKTGNKSYLMVKEKQDETGIFFRKEEVNIGLVSNNFTQIIGDKHLKDVLVKGTYYYQAE